MASLVEGLQSININKVLLIYHLVVYLGRSIIVVV